MTPTSTMHDRGPTPFQWFLSELERRPGCAATKAAVRDILRGMIGQSMLVTRRDVAAPKVAVARALLDAGFSPAEAKAELSARCGLGRTQARHYVTQALTDRAIAAAAARQPLITGERNGPV